MLKLFLDDIRDPYDLTWCVVRSYDAFVEFMTSVEDMPHVISFDHDLGFEHYPLGEQNPTDKIPYDQYVEKTGYHAAKWCVENNRVPKSVIVHSFNPVGAKNIAEVFDRYTDASVIIQPYGSSVALYRR